MLYSEFPRSGETLSRLGFGAMRVTTHRDGDDLLTAGLGADGLRSAVAPAFADAAVPTPAELRRRAVWSNWRGIADLAPGGGYGDLYGSLASVPGREYQAFATLDGAHQPHRVLTQVPDQFDASARCIVVTASSGSRGIYGAIALAGAWGLPKGCAVAYTDKGTGNGAHDLQNDTVNLIDGVRSSATAAGKLSNFTADLTPEQRAAFNAATPDRFAYKHAHSQLNPERDWGEDVLDAVRFAFFVLNDKFAERDRHGRRGAERPDGRPRVTSR